MPIRPDCLGPMVLREDGSMDVNPEGKMVGNQIFTRRSDVERVEVLEGVFQLGSLLLCDRRVGRVRSGTKDILPHCVSHLVGSDTERSGSVAPLLLVQEVCDGVV